MGTAVLCIRWHVPAYIVYTAHVYFLIFETEPCFISQVDLELKLLMHWLPKYQSYRYVSPHWPLPGYFKSSLDYFYCRIQQKLYKNGFMLCCLGNNDPP